MKYLLYIFLFLGLASCKTSLEFSGISNESNSIYFTGQLEDTDPYYDKLYVGEVSDLEYTYNRGKKKIEITITQYSEGGGFNRMTPKIMDYARNTYPRAKIIIKPEKRLMEDMVTVH